MAQKEQVVEIEGVREKLSSEEILESLLTPVELREFNARTAVITADRIMVEIGGRQKPIEGYSLHVENNNNPKLLKVNITNGDVFRDKSGVLVVPNDGTIEISGEKEFDDLKRLEKSKGELPSLPVFDPDLVIIDQRTFKQTGTLYVKVTNAKIVMTG